MLILFAALLCNKSYSTTPVTTAINLAHQTKLFASSGWHRLLHYNSYFFISPGSSQVQNNRDLSDKFFLDSQGDTDPAAEMITDLTAMFDTGESSAQCAFPARFEFLNNHLRLYELGYQKATCEKLEAFKKQLQNSCIRVVFINYFLKVFNIQFAKILLHIQDTENDSSINLALSFQSDHSQGFYTLEKYTSKLSEYENFSARDIWEYELSLTPTEQEALMNHIWELGSAQIHYNRLFDSHVSFIWDILCNISDRFSTLGPLRRSFIFGTDFINALFETGGMIKSIYHYPSQVSKFWIQYQNLSEQEKKIFELFKKKDFTLIKGLTKNPIPLQKKVLDASINYLDGFYAQEVADQKPKKQQKQKLTAFRASLGEKSDPIDVSTPLSEGPHLAHPSRRLSGAIGFAKDQPILATLGGRLALHEPLDPNPGFPSFSRIEFLNFQLLISKKLKFDFIDLIYIGHYTPFSFLTFQPSFELQTGIQREWSKNAEGHSIFFLQSALGPGFSFTPNHILYFLAGPYLSASPYFIGSKAQAGPAFKIGLFSKWLDNLRMEVSAHYRYMFFAYHPHIFKAEIKAQFDLSNHLALFTQGLWWSQYFQVTSGINIYF